MKITTLFLPILFLCTIGSLQAQNKITFTAKEQQFFESQMTQYQHWLDKTGLSKYLRTHSVRLVKHNTELEMFLVFKTTDLDSAAGQWAQLKRDFNTTAQRNLQSELFEKFVHYMDVPPEQGNIQIYMLNQRGQMDRCLHIFLWDENGTTQFEEKLNDCKAKPFDVTIAPVSIVQVSNGKTTYVSRRLSASETFDRIEAFARGKYLRTDIPDRRPEIIDLKRSTNRFRFKVEDLYKEALTEEDRGLWCKMVESLGSRCNDVTRERLEFEFEYEPETGKLHCDLEGKFGSGVYKPRNSTGWMSMEPDFEGFLTRYAEKIGLELENYLKKP